MNWSIRPGVTGLIGPNGGGKSTLMNILATLLRPTSGEILIDGAPLSDRATKNAFRRSLGFVPQEPRFVASMSCLDTLKYLCWVHQIDKAQSQRTIDFALEVVELSDRKHEKVGALSGGQRRRLAMACGIVHDPTLLILDEPTVGLDPHVRLEIRELLTRLSSERTVLISTHLVEDIRFSCDRIGVLAEGHLVFDGGFDELEAKGASLEGDSRRGSNFEVGYSKLIEELRRHK